MTKLAMTHYLDTHNRRIVKTMNQEGTKWWIQMDDGSAEQCPKFMVKLFESSQRIKLLTKIGHWESLRGVFL
tara:strand:+ start:10328 stop:10543 length:216 start_codon:yes stop_codon:yes gene_type:complete